MRFRVRLLSILFLSLIGVSALSAGCGDDDTDSEDDGGSGKGGKAGSAGKGGSGGTPATTGHGQWPPLGAPENGTCGLPEEPRWGFDLYEDTTQIVIPTRGGKSIAVSGTVTGVGDGVPSDLERAEGEENLRHVRVKAADHTYTVVVHGVTGFSAALAPGAEVTFSHHDDTCGLCGPGNIVTSLKAADMVVVQYARAPEHPTLPEGFSVELGDELCQGRSHCIAWTGHRLEVTSPNDVTLGFDPGEVDELGDYTIYAGIGRHYETKNDLEADRSSCSDSASNSTVELLFVRAH